jgi:very-short-patch-repair endonuclease
MLEPQSKKIAIEVDGPSHDLEHNGSDWLKERILQGLGWTVLHLSYRDWECLKEEEKPAFIQQLINQVKDSTTLTTTTASSLEQ